jgi:hypothetical protein
VRWLGWWVGHQQEAIFLLALAREYACASHENQSRRRVVREVDRC